MEGINTWDIWLAKVEFEDVQDIKVRPVVVIKATPEARWESLINALDEMQINQISRYQIDNMNQVDSAMIIDYRMKHPKSK